ncbi:hypothetical protein CAEBREN_01174 [Caenorhabditis brenneri]|uniref:F-box domain-containing protein n=1 Tax=Caenorhabditis brenneri TaxID=135651 RepID=G0MSG1_CAEBE|nr:hypothetical protein CAEBREN_01174 [Caenorhabditis brenneri]
MTGKTWNHLPPELKLKCLENLPFLDKCNVRGVNRNGRDLIDSFKTILRSISIYKNKPPYYQPEGWCIRVCEATSENKIYGANSFIARIDIDNWNEDGIPILCRVLNQTKQIHFFFAEDLPDDAFKQLHLSASVNINKVRLIDICPNDVSFVLNNVRHENIEAFESISFSHNYFPLRSVPSVLFHSVRMFNIHYESDPTLPAFFARKWIEEDVDVGHKLQFSSSQFVDAIVNNIYTSMNTRMIPKRVELVDRIAMNDSDKMILLKRTRNGWSANDFLFIMVVVPTDVDQAFVDNLKHEELPTGPLYYSF